MSFSLYDATIPSYLQILGAVKGLLQKAEGWARDNDVSEADMLALKLAPDMLDFAYQVKSAAYHSWGAIEGVRAGNFSPDPNDPPQSFAALNQRIDDAISGLNALDPAEVNGWLGQDMQFSMNDGAFVIPFTAENFLLSFSQPNFYFHATTAYDILRWKGVEVGKRDFLANMRVKQD